MYWRSDCDSPVQKLAAIPNLGSKLYLNEENTEPVLYFFVFSSMFFHDFPEMFGAQNTSPCPSWLPAKALLPHRRAARAAKAHDRAAAWAMRNVF